MCVLGYDMNENQGRSMKVKVGLPGARCPQYVSGSFSAAASINIQVFNGFSPLFIPADFMISIPFSVLV